MRFHLPNAIITAFGLAALGMTGWSVLQMAAFSRRAYYTTGVIGDPMVHPRIRFRSTDETQVNFIQNGFIAQPMGAEVPVAYDPCDVLDHWGTALWKLPVGLAFTILPWLGYRAEFRPGRW